MDNIQMTDRTPSDLGIMEEVEELTSEELTDEELQAIDGGVIGAVGGAVGSILDNFTHSKPIDWRSAGSWAVGGAIGGSAAGPGWGTGLAGED
jgi:lactobin A/cerein 7B family class IIb bacteriocin